MIRSLCILLAMLSFLAFPGVLHAADGSAFRNSGLPIPRFVSLKSDKVYVRSGPGQRYPIEWIYKKDHLPVEIIQEFEHWRKIRDHEGGEGWVHSTLLSGDRTAYVQAEEPVQMRERAEDAARLVAKAEPGVIAGLKTCVPEWCEITAGGYSGWVKRNSLWGIYATEEFN